MNYIKFKNNTNLIFGSGAVLELIKFLEAKKVKKIGVVIDGNLLDNNKYIENFVEKLKEQYDVITEEYREKFEPSYQYLEKKRYLFGDGKKGFVDYIIGIGGGSTIDSTKGFAILATNSEPAIKYRGFPKFLNPSIPVIAIPSTAGTGTETVYNAVFIDLNENKKLGINTENNYPVLAILDPNIVVGAPKNVIASSGLDSLVHTLESFVSKEANLISRVFSKEAFNLIINNLQKFYENPMDIESAGNMQLGAYLAIIALSNSSAGPAGALSYLIGAKYGINHGVAGSFFIGKVTRFNYENGFHKYSELYQYINNESDLTDRKLMADSVVRKIEELINQLNIPNSLIEFGIPENDFIHLIEYTIEKYSAAFEVNPVKFTEEDIKKYLII